MSGCPPVSGKPPETPGTRTGADRAARAPWVVVQRLPLSWGPILHVHLQRGRIVLTAL